MEGCGVFGLVEEDVDEGQGGIFKRPLAGQTRSAPGAEGSVVDASERTPDR